MCTYQMSVVNLHKSYITGSDELHVLKGINLDITTGEILAIIGPSGAGKSTLLHILGGLDRPTAGKVLFKNMDIFDQDICVYRSKIVGFIFQFHHLLPEFTAVENVMIPGLINRMEYKYVKERAKSLLEDVGLKHRLYHKPYQLSCGEQQRIAIARALMNNPEIILADEPIGSLDYVTGEQVYSILQDIVRNNNKTLVLVTHNEGLAKKADRIMKLYDGKLTE